MLTEALGAVAGGYAVLLGGFAVFQRDMIYHPTRFCPEPAKCGVPEMVTLPVRAQDGVMVTGWYASASQVGRPTIVIFHGNGGNVSDRAVKARFWLDQGYGVLLAGYRGYGGNQGQPSEQGLFMDGRAALGWLLNRGHEENQIVLYGESLGTGVAVQLAQEHPGLAAVILEAPYLSLPELMPSYLFPGLSSLVVDRYDSASKISSLKCPLLIIHGEQDGIVPVSHGRQLYQLARMPKEKVIIAGAGHQDVWKRGGSKAALAFLQQDDAPRPDDGDMEENERIGAWQD